MNVLGRILSVREDKGQRMITYEVDPRHAEIIIDEIGLEAAKEMSRLVVTTRWPKKIMKRQLS